MKLILDVPSSPAWLILVAPSSPVALASKSRLPRWNGVETFRSGGTGHREIRRGQVRCRAKFDGAEFPGMCNFRDAQFAASVTFSDAEFLISRHAVGLFEGARVASTAQQGSVWPPGWMTRPAKPANGEDPPSYTSPRLRRACSEITGSGQSDILTGDRATFLMVVASG